MAFHGHIIIEAKVDPRKLVAVKNWPRRFIPTCIKSFLGLGGYYKRFVDGFASIESYLATFTQKSMKLQWSTHLNGDSKS